MDRFILGEEEKERILTLHESATKRHYLSEQVNTTHDRTYDYKKEGDKYFYRKKGEKTFKKAATGGKAEEQIKIKVFKEKPSTTKVNTTTPKSTTTKSKHDLPFKSNEEGDKFRVWMNRYYPNTSKGLKLDKKGPNGGFKNSYIRKAWNHNGKGGIKGDIYTKQVLSKGGGKSSSKPNNKGNIFVSDTINPAFRSQIDFQNLKTGGSTKRICTPNDEECGQFVNDFSDKFREVGNAWSAYRNDTKLGPTMSSKFKGLNTSKQDKAIKLWQQIHKKGGAEKKSNITRGEVKSFIKGLVGSGLNPDLKIDDVVGLYYDGSENHEKAFYHGGKAWFVDGGKPGKTIRGGDGWGMNTHIGIVGAIKDGVPLIFHNIGGNVISDPASNLNIAWVKRKGGTKRVKV